MHVWNLTYDTNELILATDFRAEEFEEACDCQGEGGAGQVRSLKIANADWYIFVSQMLCRTRTRN